MICKFCHREFEDGLSECPYCHCIVDVEAQTMSRDERDTFSGVTIEEDGSVHDGPRPARQEEADFSADERQEAGDDRSQTVPPAPGLHVFNVGRSLLWVVLILIVLLGLVITFLPAFIIIAAIAAVGIFIARLFL